MRDAIIFYFKFQVKVRFLWGIPAHITLAGASAPASGE